MKIALLNLPVDNNYGGNLQRYALVKVLQDMGHEVTHLNLRFNFNPEPLYVQCYRILRRIASRVLKRSRCEILPEIRRQRSYVRSCAVTDAFYNRYVKHTKPIYSKKGLQKHVDYDAFMVGSDQVWRKTIAFPYGISTFFFDYLPTNKLRIAYGSSLGTDVNELSEDDISFLTPLYEKFSAVSVREDSGLALLQGYGWNNPSAQQVIDPTLLLSSEDYSALINQAQTVDFTGNLFCYILDMTDEKMAFVKKIEKEKGLTSFYVSLNECPPCIEQWLRYFRDSDYVITDSYHGLVFSTIFNKNFYLFRNEFRGNARFDSFIRMIYNNTDIIKPNWDIVNMNVKYWREMSFDFIRTNI